MDQRTGSERPTSNSRPYAWQAWKAKKRPANAAWRTSRKTIMQSSSYLVNTRKTASRKIPEEPYQTRKKCNVARRVCVPMRDPEEVAPWFLRRGGMYCRESRHLPMRQGRVDRDSVTKVRRNSSWPVLAPLNILATEGSLTLVTLNSRLSPGTTGRQANVIDIDSGSL